MSKRKQTTTIVVSKNCWFELYKLKGEPNVSMETVIMRLLEEHKCQ